MNSKTYLNINSWFIAALVMVIVATQFSLRAGIQQEAKSGKKLYGKYCKKCHGRKGKGVFGIPPLTDPRWIENDNLIVNNIINGIKGEIKVNGKVYVKEMEAVAELTDKEISLIVNYIRRNFTHSETLITKEKVTQLRMELSH